MTEGWTSIEQVGRMAAAAVIDARESESSETTITVTLRRVVTENTNGTPRWIASAGIYSSKACRTVEEAVEEVAGMYRSDLLARAKSAQKRIANVRAAIGDEPLLSESNVPVSK